MRQRGGPDIKPNCVGINGTNVCGKVNRTFPKQSKDNTFDTHTALSQQGAEHSLPRLYLCSCGNKARLSPSAASHVVTGLIHNPSIVKPLAENNSLLTSLLYELE